MLDKAIRIAATAFEGKKDKGGHPYILHCLHVMQEVRHLGTEAMIAAVLHDLLEDCSKDWGMDKLLSEGFNFETIAIINTLTRRGGELYMESYIKRVASHPIAKAIKLADLRHNSDITRMKGLREKDFQRLQKYFTAYEYLKN